MTKVGKIARLTLGLLLLIFGLNGLLAFMGERILPPDAEVALQMIDNLIIIRPLMSSFAILTGIMLLADILVPVALSVALIMIVSAIMYHMFFYPKGSMFAFLGLIAAIVVIYDYRQVFRRIIHEQKK